MQNIYPFQKLSFWLKSSLVIILVVVGMTISMELCTSVTAAAAYMNLWFVIHLIIAEIILMKAHFAQKVRYSSKSILDSEIDIGNYFRLLNHLDSKTNNPHNTVLLIQINLVNFSKRVSQKKIKNWYTQAGSLLQACKRDGFCVGFDSPFWVGSSKI